ncbi:MAG TPA: glycosyltransferase [Stellaceae bacterium]|nr:glycosyltransferase [Stellaceae bacterium]
MARKPPELSVVVVGYRMQRELPRTLRSLSPAMQRDIAAGDYEIILVDNGSPEPMPMERFPAFGAQVSCHHIANAAVSPAAAANFGLRQARGRVIGLMLDGARLASLGFHLGFAQQMESTRHGYDQAAEDALLASANWTEDGYRLFDIATLAGSSEGGLFLAIGESNALFMSRRLWRELGGLDENFASPGGGYVNLDLYRRACELPGSRLVVMLGEATFHQVHGGAAANAAPGRHLEFHEEYVRLRQKPHVFPDREAIFLGHAPPQVLPLIEQSARIAQRAAAARSPRRDLPPGFDPAWYLARHKDVAAAGLAAGEHFLRYGQFEGRAWRP